MSLEPIAHDQLCATIATPWPHPKAKLAAIAGHLVLNPREAKREFRIEFPKALIIGPAVIDHISIQWHPIITEPLPYGGKGSHDFVLVNVQHMVVPGIIL